MTGDAHHSFSGIFDVSEKATHYLHLDVATDQGKTTTWALETLPSNWMRRAIPTAIY